MNKALGETSVGLRLSNQINYLNPASYSARDTLSFLLDVGFNGSLRTIESQSGKSSFNDVNFNNLAISFPVTRWWGAAIGVLPYSKVGYNITESVPFEGVENTSHKITYEGKGGLSQFFIGSGFRIGKNVSIGGNLSYLFGRLERDRYVSMVETSSGSLLAGTAVTNFSNEMTMNNVQYSFGLQFFNDFGKHNLVAGLTLDNKTNLKGDLNSFIYSQYRIANDTIYLDTISGSATIPLRYGLGLSYTFNDKLLVAFDYIGQDWSDSKFFGKTDSLTNSSSFRFGIQYAPIGLNEVRRSKYWQRINFRVGGYYTNTYLKIGGNQINDYGMTFGLGIPWKTKKSDNKNFV
ncbi:MAG: hypothetical protein HC906_01720 [Bacteroidales bacterium]|nr:hypothetical protein [Bacteroidales bacterium]